MSSRKHGKSDITYGVIFDIESGTVGVAVVASGMNDALPTIIYAHRTSMRVPKDGISQENQLRRVREALFSVALTLSQEGYQALNAYDASAKISKILISCSSPWSYTVARNVCYEDEEPFKITRTIVNDLIHSADQEVLSHIREQTEFKDDDFEVIEQATVDMVVNGYVVTNPLNLKGTSLGLSHVVGLLPKDLLSAIYEIQEKLFPNAECKAHSAMLVMFCILRDIFPENHSLWIINVTSDATEFGIMENNLLIENSYINYGMHTFIRNIMTKTGQPGSNIETHMTEYTTKNIQSDPETSAEITEYTQLLVKKIQEIQHQRSLPKHIVVVGPQQYKELITRAIKEAFTELSKKEVPILWLESNIVKTVDTSGTDDIYLHTGARFFHKLHGCGDLETK